MKIIHFGKKERQFKHLVRQLKKMLHDAPSSLKTQALALKIRQEIEKLQKVITGSKMRRILGPTAIMLGVSFGSLQAQSFGAAQANPFGLDVATATATDLEDKALINNVLDLDGDGDLDLLVSDYYGTFHFFENTGTSSTPVFNSKVQNNFGFDSGTSNSYVFPNFADIDNDGDYDILTMNNEFQTLEFYENTGTSSNPSFSTVTQSNPFGFSLPPQPSNGFSRPYLLKMVDLDSDGDLDLFATGITYDGANDYETTIFYYENISTNSTPSFAAPQVNSLGINLSEYFIYPAFSDLDSDGDLDLMVGELYYGGFDYFENTGTSTSPVFTTPIRNPFGLTPVDEVSSLVFADFDNDGDDDILVAQYFEYVASEDVFVYFENTTTTGVDETKNDFELGISPNPARDILQIQTTENISEIRILDILGKQVYLDSYQGGEIPIGNLSSGTYFVKIFNEEGKQATKMIQKL